VIFNQVAPEVGFGGTTVVAPFAVVPGDSTLSYEVRPLTQSDKAWVAREPLTSHNTDIQVEVLRVSNSGPDELMRYISFCGQGGAGAQNSGCNDIPPL
jgi:hypothetical protein